MNFALLCIQKLNILIPMFHKDSFSTFQFAQYHFKKTGYVNTLRKKLDNWSQTHFKVDANVETVKGAAKEFVLEIVKCKPSKRIGNNTHLFALFPDTNELVCLLDHYYCDGLILFDFIKQIFKSVKGNLNFPKYTYYPIVSDALVCDFSIRTLYNTYTRPIIITEYDKTRIFTRITHKTENGIWNRWSNYAMNVLPIFECANELAWVRVAINIGFDTDKTFGNNRIGAIVVCIEKPSSHLSYDLQMECLMKQFQEQVALSYKDGMTSYDLLRSYNTTAIRRFASTNVVTIYFTSLLIPRHTTRFDFLIGSFPGNDYDCPFFYINSTTIHETNYTTFTTNWTQFDDEKLISNFDAKHNYTFE